MYKKDERKRLALKKTPSTNYSSEIKKEIEKAEKTKEGVSCCIINKLLTDIPYFIGCFAQDQLSSITFDSFPLSLIVNFDTTANSGSHWIALYIDKRSVEVFDSLGFQLNR